MKLRRATDGLTVQRRDTADTGELLDGYVAEHARHTWASTIAGAQGATVNDALLLARPSFDRNTLYVRLTRGRDSTHLYLTPPPEPGIKPRNAAAPGDPKAELRAMLERVGDQGAAPARLPQAATGTRTDLSATRPELQALRHHRLASRGLVPTHPVECSLRYQPVIRQRIAPKFRLRWRPEIARVRRQEAAHRSVQTCRLRRLDREVSAERAELRRDFDEALVVPAAGSTRLRSSLDA